MRTEEQGSKAEESGKNQRRGWRFVSLSRWSILDPRSPRFNRWRPLALGTVFLGLVVGAYFLGRCATLPAAAAAQGDDPKSTTDSTTRHSPLTAHHDASSRQVVAYIYGSIAITRQELGEYLIARQGAERLDLMVAGRIIDLTCQKKGIVVNDAEVDAALAEDLIKMNIPSIKDFVKVLEKNKTTLYEYKEDVLRPKLALAKLCRGQVQVTEDDIHKGFEAYHGAKVECQMIMWPEQEKNRVFNETYAKIRDNADEFDRVARSQAASNLASVGGHVAPFGRHTTGNDVLENEAFKLRPGEISRVMETPQGIVVLKCIRHIEAQTEEELAKQVKEALTSDATPGLPTHPPHGN